MKCKAFSVVVPAHNEAAIIRRSLRHMLSDTVDVNVEVLVVCNGCTDGTPVIAKEVSPCIRVIELEEGSKPNAINAGLEEASHPICAVVDADIQVTLRSIGASVCALADGRAKIAAPKLEINVSGCSYAVKLYYSIWRRLPYVTDNLVGSGVYVLGPEARERVGQIPDIIGDDAYVRACFSPAERISVRHDETGKPAVFVVSPPRTIRALRRIESRRRAADEELAILASAAPNVASPRPQMGSVLNVVRTPWRVPALVVFIYVKVASRIMYRVYRRQGRRVAWIRDDTSRAT